MGIEITEDARRVSGSAGDAPGLVLTRLRADEQDGYLAAAQHGVRHAAKDQAPETAAAVARHDDQACTVLSGQPQDGVVGISFHYGGFHLGRAA